MNPKRWTVVVNHLVLGVMALAVVGPVIWLLLAAMSPKLNAGVVLTDLRPGNFVTAYQQSNFGRHLLNSLLICGVVVPVTALISLLAGYGLVVIKLPGARWVLPIFIAGMMIPLEGILVPLYYQLRDWHLTGNLIGLMISHIGMGVPFGVFWARACLQAVPRELLESAEIDGCGHGRSLWQIVVPVIRPALITLVLLMFMWTWNDYFLAFVLVGDSEQMPVTLALSSFSTRRSASVNLMAAAAVLVCLPVLILYAAFQREFIEGVLSGAVKG